MKKLIFLILGMWLVGCEGYDETAQFALDQDLIADYVAANSLVGIYDNSGIFVVVQDSGMADPDTTRKQDSPFSSDTLLFTYNAFTLDGTQVASSGSDAVIRNTGFYPTLAQLNDGLRTGIPYFRRSGSGQLIVPSTLAYGPYGTDLIAPNEVIRFEIELIDFY